MIATRPDYIESFGGDADQVVADLCGTSPVLVPEDTMRNHWCHPIEVDRTAEEQIDSINKCLSLEAEYLFPGHELPRHGKADTRDYLEDMLVKQLQLERRILVLLNRHGALTVPELHAESFVIKERYDYNDYSLNCTHSHVCRLADQQKVIRTERDDGQVDWEVTEAGRLSPEETDIVGGFEKNMQTPLLEGLVAGRS